MSSAIITQKSIPGKEFSAWVVPPHPPVEPDFQITSRPSRVLSLPAVTLATLRFRTGPADVQPETIGDVTDACHRLAVLWARGVQMSAWEVAEEFQRRYFPTGVSGWRRNLEPMRRVPLKGLDMIRATAELGAFCVEWRCDVPTEHDEFAFERVSLTEALDRYAPTVQSSKTGPRNADVS